MRAMISPVTPLPQLAARSGRPLVLLCAATVLALHAAGGVPLSHAGDVAPSPAEFPEFRAEPCCQLCPAAADSAFYTTSFLRVFDTLLQGTDGWLFRSKVDLMTSFGPDEAGLRHLVRLRSTLQAYGVELVLVMQPPRGLMHRDKLSPSVRASYNWELAQFSYVHALQTLRAAGFVVPDLERLVYADGRDDFFFRADHHWTPEGARRTAEVVAERIRAMPQYSSLPRKRYVTVRNGLFAKRGTMAKAAQQLCGFGTEPQYVANFSTEPADEASADTLLGEPSPPPVALIGTSNSDPAYNFAGFLQEQLQVDILNAAVSGGGLDGAPLSYLPSREFREHPPKILIWEIEPYHNLSDEIFYRRIIPVVAGGCEGPAILTDDRELRAGVNEVLFNGGRTVRDLRASDYLLDLRFSRLPAQDIKAVVWYTNGNSDAVVITRSSIDGSGHYLVELRQDQGYADLAFLSLDLNVRTAETTTLRVESRLCARADRTRGTVASLPDTQ
ncbi:MAG: alginate O-acetyltransferase [Sinimarinibacterium sp.]|jgi:alginate biosynthesis protein AlgX